MAATPEGCTTSRLAASRDVEDAVPYGWVVCKAPQDYGIT